MWSISVEFLRGVCVATTDSDRTAAEWPPHPARLFMAIAAAYFETREQPESEVDELHRNALEWLEAQSPPTLYASEAGQRQILTVFVPVNDSVKADQLMADKRGRQPRYFPTSLPHEPVLHYVYIQQPPPDVVRGLESLLPEVVRIGHSSSLVTVWLQSDFNRLKTNGNNCGLLEWQCTESRGDGTHKLRVACVGSLAMLEACFNGPAIDEFSVMNSKIVAAKGKAKKQLKQELERKFPNGMPAGLYPIDWRAIYYNHRASEKIELGGTCFDTELLVLSILDGPALGLETTLQLAGALRKKIHDQYPDRKSPEWLGGHQADGAPSTKPHVAIVPLPFVGSQHADGHLLGLAMAFPHHVSKRDRVAELAGMFYQKADAEEDWLVDLELPGFGRLSNAPGLTITMKREVDRVRARALQGSTWSRPARVWETVTPIVLDRYPKQNRVKNRLAWRAEVEQIVAASCRNIDAPEPLRVTVNHNAFISGVPGARSGKTGFPGMPKPGGGGVRFHVHARIEFDQPLCGPVMLGAGRFVGYGLCRPAENTDGRRGPKERADD
ncbi:type I-U CRISPR-associated protein Cas5/Cas6 [Chromatiales bacterium (ex Bugula neritina AB1)]|nr:type I-U CRISPR-associated protein Cas5/Cas6 [Chromatiales bacterium (ex Bugula neritina AB1)]